MAEMTSKYENEKRKSEELERKLSESESNMKSLEEQHDQFMGY